MKPSGALFIVRHGESGWNRAGLVQGQSLAAPGLTELGRQHAVDAASYLATRAAGVLVTSDLLRAVETALPIAARLGLSIQVERRLRERAFGIEEGRPSGEVGVEETGVDGQFVVDVDRRPAGGESVRQLYERIIYFLRELATSKPDERIVVVTHGGPVRVVQAWLAGHGPAEMSWSSVLNGSILEVRSAQLCGGG